jgi:hypothetical protein
MNQMTQKVHFVSMLLLSVCFLTEAVTIEVPEKAPTISAGLIMAKKGDTVIVESGVYKEHIYIGPFITLLSKTFIGAVLNGEGRGTIVTLGSGATISGFEIINGSIGVFSTSANVTITQCRIQQNQQSGVMCAGSLPRIEDNLIIFNHGSGFQGWDVRTTSSSINHNTIAFNSNHGISIGGNSSIIVENNIIAFNDQYGIKPSEETVRISMINNCFYQNTKFSNTLPSDNFSFDPSFKNARNLNFSLNNESRCIGKSTDNQDLGARLAY